MQEGATAAVFAWKQGAVSISYSGRELRSNKGSRAKIADLVKTKQAQAELSLSDIMSTGVFSDGTGSSGNQLTGFAAMIETTPGTASYASVPIANTAWRNQAAASVGNAAVNMLPNMRTVYNNCSQGKAQASSSPDAIFTTRAMFETYEALMTPLIRTEPGGKGDLGFRRSALTYKGGLIDWSAYCTSGVMVMLNSNHVFLVVHEDANMSMAPGGFQRPANQDSFVGQVLWMGNLVTNNRRKLGKLQGLS